MRTPERTIKPKRKLPFLTEEELNEKVSAVKIHIFGRYYKNGEHRGEVYEEDYAADVIVPKAFDLGHVKLMANRYVKDPRNTLRGIRVQTFYVDADFAPEPVKDKEYTRKDFISDMGLQQNERDKQNHIERLERKRLQREAEENGEFPEAGSVEVQSRTARDRDFYV